MAVALRETVRAYQPREHGRLGQAELAALCRQLEQRLLRGQDHIRAARAAGQEVASLEARWAELLAAYERLSDLRARCARRQRVG